MSAVGGGSSKFKKKINKKTRRQLRAFNMVDRSKPGKEYYSEEILDDITGGQNQKEWGK